MAVNTTYTFSSPGVRAGLNMILYFCAYQGNLMDLEAWRLPDVLALLLFLGGSVLKCFFKALLVALPSHLRLCMQVSR